MNRALVILFLVAVSMPLAANLAGVDGADPDAEKRDLAPFPQWDWKWRTATTYPDSLGRWFDDHFGFRASLVRGYGETRVFALNVSPSSAVLKGRDGWLFYADDGGLDDYANDRPLSALETGVWREAIVRAGGWLRQRGVAYVFAIAPDKHVIYPEQMPESLRPIRPVSRMDQVYAALGATAVDAVDFRPALVQAKSAERVYFLTGTHWNDRGALVAYQQIIEAVRRQLASVSPAWTRSDFEPGEVEIRGQDLAGMLGLKDVLHETDLRLLPRKPRRARVVDPPGVDPMSELGRLVTEVADTGLPRAVIFRDSFISRLVPFLSEHFSRAVYLWQKDFDASVVSDEHPDVVIQEIVGRHLYGFLPSPELVPGG
jgi:alginate O-acetyltransferase complex protein AlgJ